MPLVIGTAGHIDHGKTALIRALTGQDTDRLKEEKERGISIDLGFACFEQEPGVRVGVVDVPGHERFIRNMLAGAHGIDLVLFAVAADDGVMPQTEEHLDILHLLGVRRGVFALTKVDLVDEPRIASVREDLEVLTLDTSLEGIPIVPVSTVTGSGLAKLREEIAAQLARPARPAAWGPFRLPVDRAFVMHGHGLVVTGTAVAGSVRLGDTVRILPGGETARVRGLEVHGVEVGEARWGQRTAINLGGVERDDVQRGHVVCDPALSRATTRFDARVETRPGTRQPLRHHGRIRVHLGTAEVLGKLVVLDGRQTVPAGGEAWVQLMLSHPVVALRGDRFIVRDETARWTLGGGQVVNPFAERHRAGDRETLARLEVLCGDDLAAAAGTFLALSSDFASSLVTIAQALNVRDEDVPRALGSLPDVVPIPAADSPDAYTTAAKWDRLRTLALETLAAAHRGQPLAPGVELESLRRQLPWDVPLKVFRWGIDRLVAAKDIIRDESVVRLPSHSVALEPAARALGERITALLVAGRFTPPDLRQLAEATGVDRTKMAAVLGVLEAEGRVARIAPDIYYDSAAATEARRLIASHCATHGEITAAQFRDLIQASRKFAIAFLDWCDRTGTTVRVGDVRKLRRCG